MARPSAAAGRWTRTALGLLYDALRGYAIQADRDRALNDLAVNFVELGLLDAAHDAYLVVLATAQEQATRWLAMVNLLAVSGLLAVPVGGQLISV